MHFYFVLSVFLSIFQKTQAITYKVSVAIQPPFVEKDADGKWTGYCIDLLSNLSALMDFDIKIHEVKDGKYGAMAEDGSWDGMIGEIISGEADLAVGALTVTADREDFVDFTETFYDLVGLGILMKKPRDKSSIFEFMYAVKTEVWLSLLACLLVTAALLYLDDKISPFSFSNNKEKYKDDPEKREFTVKESIWFTMTTLSPQGGGETPKSLSGRIVVITWWLFTFIILAAYTANLAAILTVVDDEQHQPIKSMDDLASQKSVQFSTLESTHSQTYFRRMANIEQRIDDDWKEMALEFTETLPIWNHEPSRKYRHIWNFMRETGFVKSHEEAIKKVLDSPSESEGYAFVGDSSVIDYAVMTDETCTLKKIGSTFSPQPYAIAVKQGSPLRYELSMNIFKLANNQGLQALKDNWWLGNPNKVTCPESSGKDGITLENFGGVFVVILAGIGLSIPALIFEYLYHKKHGDLIIIQ